jgi:CubicO group peptidase (beta-lactamase class C family)
VSPRGFKRAVKEDILEPLGIRDTPVPAPCAMSAPIMWAVFLILRRLQVLRIAPPIGTFLSPHTQLSQIRWIVPTTTRRCFGTQAAWAGQAAALARAEPAGELVLRLWREAEALLPGS